MNETPQDPTDFPVLTEYRALLAGLYRRLYQLDARRLDAVFPGVAPLDLQII